GPRAHEPRPAGPWERRADARHLAHEGRAAGPGEGDPALGVGPGRGGRAARSQADGAASSPPEGSRRCLAVSPVIWPIAGIYPLSRAPASNLQHAPAAGTTPSASLGPGDTRSDTSIATESETRMTPASHDFSRKAFSAQPGYDEPRVRREFA